MTLIMQGSSPQTLKYKFAAVLIRMERLSKVQAGNIVRELDETGLHKIFTNSAEATFNVVNPENCGLILNALQDAGIIREYTQKDNGKMQVRIRRLRE